MNAKTAGKTVKNDYVDIVNEITRNKLQELTDDMLFQVKDFQKESIGRFFNWLKSKSDRKIKLEMKRSNSVIMKSIEKLNKDHGIKFYDNVTKALKKHGLITEKCKIIDIPNIATVVFDEFGEYSMTEYQSDNNNPKKVFDRFIRGVIDDPKNETIYLMVRIDDYQKMSFEFIKAMLSDVQWLVPIICDKLNIKKEAIEFVPELTEKDYCLPNKKYGRLDIAKEDEYDYNVIVDIKGKFTENRNKLQLFINAVEDDDSIEPGREGELKKCGRIENKRIEVHNGIKFIRFPLKRWSLNVDFGFVEEEYLQKYIGIEAQEVQEEVKIDDRDAKINRWIDVNKPGRTESRESYLVRLNTALGEHIHSSEMHKIMIGKSYNETGRFRKDGLNYRIWTKVAQTGSDNI